MSLKVVSFKDTNNTMNTNNLEEKINHFHETDNIQIEIEQNELNEQNQYVKKYILYFKKSTHIAISLTIDT